MPSTRRRWLLPLSALPAAVWPFALDLQPQGTIDWVEVGGEATLCLIALAWIGALSRSELPHRTLLPLSVAVISGFAGLVPDLVEELWALDGLLPSLVENVGTVLGSSALSLGLLRWYRAGRAQLHQLQETSQHFETLAQTDELTGLSVRQVFFDELAERLPQTQPLSVLMFDIDDFKEHNDRFGHPAGDEVIRTLAGVIQSRVRGHDVACRWGGEEFTVLLVGVGLSTSREIADRIRQAFADIDFFVEGQAINKTVSGGVAERQPDDTAETLVERADRALLAAKAAGKNRIEIGGMSSGERPSAVTPGGDWEVE